MNVFTAELRRRASECRALAYAIVSAGIPIGQREREKIAALLAGYSDLLDRDAKRAPK